MGVRGFPSRIPAARRSSALHHDVEAGATVRRPALTDSALSEYHKFRGLKAKEDFEAVMAYAQTEGAILALRPRSDPQGLIERIELIDVAKLASILGKVPHAARVQSARQTLASRLGEPPILNDVLSSWERLKKVRGIGPELTSMIQCRSS
ncbi:hypothetical protein KEC55_31665 [Burkholderia cepacia]|uniref:hypothetical protein n=1 Tax=Burkholderia cepacia TaxID=292 RepID=UPI00249F73EF|nr:hypothetical protein [Burkholderia cepacia]WGY73334.1 hypothetical protein KEC55_31665 [Burkholderia cepacia]